ncbi:MULTISPECIES: non-ribosomal peptide synthetase [unclassified Caballeronia]|uniref:non-ribosomal peptide synthetase n=1 Tax=unclassified Caballeronia TaxID=2646786 RepID=UPI00285A6B6B|nr:MULTISPECIES: non-ribosomal peptide synthetase [unclassified Caballeronia]MDR5770279.1 amino acid adenylation domain-containing protein [Caballeronia sp. LZ002]MDR5845716.1 amino acid adenylation domain-containing protein [Caballeronia sp. LZ003]
MKFETYPLSRTQARAAKQTAAARNLCAVFRLDNVPDSARLARAVARVARHSQPLRWRVIHGDDGPRYLLHEIGLAELEVVDIDDADEASASSIIQMLCARPLRIDAGAPWALTLLRGASRGYLVFACHPALLDRFSLQPLFAAISRSYAGETLAGELSLDQRGVLVAERASMEAEQWRGDLAFWVRQLADGEFAWQPPRVEGAPGEASFTMALGAATSGALREQARVLGLSIEFLLQSCLHVLLQKMSRQSAVITAHHRRGREQPYETMGHDERLRFICSEFDDAMTLRQYLHHAASQLAMADFHGNIPAGDIFDELKRLRPEYDRATNVLCERDHLPHDALVLGGARGVLLTRFCRRPERQDVAIYLHVSEDITLHVQLRHPQASNGLSIVLEHYAALLSGLAVQLDTPVGELGFDTASLDARRRAWSLGAPLASPPRDVLACIDEMVRTQPDAPALSGPDARFTYAELAEASARIADALAPHAKANGLVGVCVSRGARVVAAMVGVLAAGAGYVPLDPLMPEERLRFMAEDAQLCAVIADTATQARVRAAFDCPALLIEDMFDTPSGGPSALFRGTDPSHAAYVIYTSGTTGRPKGVVIERGMLAHMIASLEGRYARNPGTRWLQFASVNFDASVFEIFNPLAHGGQLVVAPDSVRADPAALFDFLAQSRITHAFLPPAVLRLLPRRPLPELDTIMCGGEASDDDTVRFWSSVVRLSNIYGPTEATVLCTENTFGDQKLANQLGRPLPGYAIHLLDANGRGVPLGGIGELCIGGESVARGYLRRPEMTAEKFIDDANANEGRLYRSGDLGRFLPNGEIEFLGRSDFQVKVRGYRIEIAEVEHVIATQPEVSAVCIGTHRHQGSNALVAWYTANGLAAAELRQRLETLLPAYMVPAFIVPIAHWPLTLNGKIDRARLPAPSTPSSQASARQFDSLECAVQSAWAATLDVTPDAIDESSHFFEAGGHSLLATLACGRIGAALGVNVKPGLLLAHPGFDAFCHALRNTLDGDDALTPLLHDARAAPSVAITSGIVEALFHRARIDRTDNAYNIVVRADFSREVNPLELHAALKRLFSRDSLFSSTLTDAHGELRLMSVASRDSALIPIQSATAETIRAHIDAWTTAAIHPDAAPCWRAHMLLDAESGVSTVLIGVHHALFDGWSLKLLLDELAALYEGKPFAQRTPNWFDYCAWMHEIAKTPAHARARNYWTNKLRGTPLRLELPFDFTTRHANANRIVPVHLTRERADKLRRIAQDRGTTLSPVLFALHLAWLWRLSGQPTIVSGYPQAGRDIPGSENVYGMLVSMAVMKVRIDPRQSFGELVSAVHAQMLEDRDHLLATPYEAGIEDIGALNTLFSLQSGIDLQARIGAGSVSVEELPTKTSKADISVILYANQQGEIDGRIEYDGSLFEARSAHAMKDVLDTLIDAAANQPSALVGEFAYLSDAQRALITGFSRGAPLDDAASSIPARFASIASRFADREAIRFENETLRYDELDALSERIAGGLLERVTEGSCVGLAMAKGPLLVAVILGVLKAGCAYVPLDPSYPAERLTHFATNCALTACIADADGRAGLEAAQLSHLTFLDAEMLARAVPRARPDVSPDALAYVIHTSGSTGKPKGVLIEHHSVARMVAGAATALGYAAGCISTLVASTNFDASVLEIFLALLNGGTLVIAPEAARRDPEVLHGLLERESVTHAILAPVLLQGLPKRPLPAMQMLAFGGDTLDETAARWWSGQTRLFALYGPTEATVMATCGQIAPDGRVRVLGKPLPGYDVYLLDAQSQRVPVGSIGEICIGGANLARGYRNESTLTMRRFVADPFAGKPYARMYKTGDLGRYLANGEIEYFGRNDEQIKLRGFRIELGEIENELASVPGVESVACAMRGEGEQRYIAAYYVLQADAYVDEDRLRAQVAAALPDYMAPARYTELTALPVSGSGKIDRRALPEPAARSSGAPPRAGVEADIAAIWCALLHLDTVSREDDFFHLGGNSILAMRMHARVRAETGIDFAIPAFYRAPTIAALANGDGYDDIARAVADAALPLAAPDVALPPWHEKNGARIGSVVLTGASGFIGIHLLAELSRRTDTIFCLQRCADPAAGLARLVDEARAAGLAIDFSRVQVLCADLGRPRLGLSDADWQQLAERADAILHCGALVHHLHGYGSLKAANVGGTEALLQLALSVRMKPLCFLSTMSVPMMQQGATRVEERIDGARPQSDNGYLLGKWVGEQRVLAYSRAYGLPATVVRVGNVTGHGESGYSNYRHNHFWLFNQGCIQMGAYPATGQPVEMTPVDLLARAVCALALHPRDGLHVANLQNPERIEQAEWFDALARQGLRANPETPEAWKQRLATIDPTNGLALLRDFYTGDLDWHDMPVEQIGTISRLARFDVSLTIDRARLMRVYVRYLRNEGFMPIEAKTM